MALSIKSAEAERLTRELAEVTGESLTDAITVAVRERSSLGRQRTAGVIVDSSAIVAILRRA